MTLLDETRHGLEDGDYVTFTEIKGMEALNNAEPRKIVVKGQSCSPDLASSGADRHRSLHLYNRRYPRTWHLQVRWSLHAGQDAKDPAIRESSNDVTGSLR